MGKQRRSLTAYLVLSHMSVAALTSVAANVLALILVTTSADAIYKDWYEVITVFVGAQWLFGGEDGLPNSNEQFSDFPPGWSLLVSDAKVVQYSQGDTACRAEMLLADCAPELLNSEPGERVFERNGVQWAEYVYPTVLDQQAIIQRGPFRITPTIDYIPGIGPVSIRGIPHVLGLEALTIMLISMPLALLLGWVFIQPRMRRLAHVTEASQRFAAGAFDTRVHDATPDEIGQLARQFNTMAAALAQNIETLRSLAEDHAILAAAAETTAIHHERFRLSRDLHDAIAQRLFSLSMISAALPASIATDPHTSIKHARQVADLAETTLLDVRRLLVQLRDSDQPVAPINDLLSTLCQEWQQLHCIALECTIVLSGSFLSTTISDVVVRITQEALSNIVKHAQASQVSVTLVEGHKHLMLSISDNGRGFDPQQQVAVKHIGLRSMHERVRAVGGTLSIESNHAHGTTIYVELPLRRA